MDKVKAQLAVVKQHSFWIMCGGILLVCLVSWYMSTRAIYQEQQKQLADITTKFKDLDTIRTSNPKHPNAQTEQGMDALTLDYSREVFKSWQKQYDRQSAVLVWPASFDPKFIERVELLRPIEKVPPPPTAFANELPLADLVEYRNFIEPELPKLAETIGTVWLAKSANSGADGFDSSSFGAGGAGPGGLSGRGGMGAAMPGGSAYSQDATGQALVDDKSIVLWAAENQQQLLLTHFGFVTREQPPSTLEVLYAQEDLWVLQNVMDIIKAANDNATARHEAAIKQIDFVRIGRSAMGMAGAISSAGMQGGGMYGDAAGGMPGGMPGGMGGGIPGRGMGGPAMMGAAAGGAATGSIGAPVGEGGSTDAAGGSIGAGMYGVGAGSTDPAYGRYVDGTYQPLDPTKLRSALTSKSKEDALLAVAKRMPVRMRFRVDQRRMNKVLAECGNSRLPVEVRQVRINRGADSGGMGGMGEMGGYDGSSGSSGRMSMPGMGSGMGSGMGVRGAVGEGSFDGGGRGMSSFGASGGGASVGSLMPGSGVGAGVGAGGASRAVGGENFTAAVDPHLIDVELYGIVYIYNPVNRSQLGLDPAAGSVATPTAVPAATPAASPAPPASGAPATGPAAILPGAGSN